MSLPPSQWSAPESVAPDDARARTDVQFSAGSPLGGTIPTVEVQEPTSDRRDLVLTGILLVAAVLVGGTSLLPWRDFGRQFGATATETGWVNADGSMGRGWIVIVLAVALAVAGVLIAAERVRWGRILASFTGAALVLVSIVEWGLGAGSARSGPGTGLWALLVIGVLVIVAVGVLGPSEPSAD